MKVEICDAGPCQKKIKVVIPEESVTQKLEEEFSEMGSMVNIPGFRKGRVPRKILEKRFGDHVEDKVKTDLIEETLKKVFEEHQLDPIGTPKVEEMNFERNKPFSFETLLEVRPEFDLPPYKGLKLQKEVKEASEEDLTNALQDVFEKTNKKLIALEDGAVEDRDIVIADLSVSADGKEVVAKEEVYIYAGEDQIGPIKIKGLKEQLLGKKIDDSLEFKQKLDDDFPVEEARGKEGTIAITLLEIKRPKYKEPNDEWARENDYEDLQEIQDFLSKEINKKYIEHAEQKLKTDLLDSLLEPLDFDIPPGMVEESMEKHIRYEQAMRKLHGGSEEDIEKWTQESMGQWDQEIRREIRVFFILDSIVKKEKIYVTEGDMEEKLLGMAQQYGRNVEDLTAEFEESGYLSRIRWQLKEEKAIDFLLKKAKIEEVSPSSESE